MNPTASEQPPLPQGAAAPSRLPAAACASRSASTEIASASPPPSR